MGFDLHALQTIESKEAVLRAGYSGEVADGFHARSRDFRGLVEKDEIGKMAARKV